MTTKEKRMLLDFVRGEIAEFEAKRTLDTWGGAYTALAAEWRMKLIGDHVMRNTGLACNRKLRGENTSVINVFEAALTEKHN